MLSPLAPTIEGRPRSRSFSSTPTFSSDLAKLKTAVAAGREHNNSDRPQDNSNRTCIVHTYEEARRIASSWDVLGPGSPLFRKVKLVSDADWHNFFDAAKALDTGCSHGDNAQDVSINLEKLLRHCFDIAYAMPPSPARAWKSPLLGPSGVGTLEKKSQPVSPPELSI